MKKSSVVFLSLMLVVTGLAGCLTATDAHIVPNSDTFFEAVGAEPDSVDPAVGYDSASGQVIQQVYETLVSYEGTSTTSLKPVLAREVPTRANGGISSDGRVYTFKLREGVTFHNGDTLTAEDVKFTLDRLILMANHDGPAGLYQNLKGAKAYLSLDDENQTQSARDAYLAAGAVQIVSPLTVRITLENPDPSFLTRLAFTGAAILSKEGVKANIATPDGLVPVGDEDRRDDFMDKTAIGTGPFKLKEWKAGERVVLERFEGYWGEKAKLKTVVLQKTADFNSRLLSLQKGEADAIYVPLDQVSVVQSQLTGPDYQIVTNLGMRVHFLGFNQKVTPGKDSDANVPRGIDGTPDPNFFTDIHMRRAFSYAFDYEGYSKNILEGMGSPIGGPVPKGMPVGYDDSLPLPKQDLQKAREELAKSRHPNGFSIKLYYNLDNTARERTMLQFAQDLERLLPGRVRAEAVGLEWSSAFLPATRNKELPIFYLGWTPDYAFADNFIQPFLDPNLGVFAKRVGYKNDTLTQMYLEALTENDPEQLQGLYSEIQKGMTEDAAYMWLAQLKDTWVARSWVKGYAHNPLHSGNPNTGEFATVWKA